MKMSAQVGAISPGVKKPVAGKFEDGAAVGKPAGQVFRESTGAADSMLVRAGAEALTIL